MKNVAIIGSTGSIGTQTLAVLDNTLDDFVVHSLVADKNFDKLSKQVQKWQPKFYSCNAPNKLNQIGKTRLVSLDEIVNSTEIDIFVFASSGYANLKYLLTALQSGKTIVVANKELLVIAGEQIVKMAHANSTKLLPMDSEPVAVLQCLEGETTRPARVLLTASGGAFRGLELSKLANVTPEEALQHPTWSMGPQITIDSATLVNKAFEVAELYWFFKIPFERVEVVIHPQSYFHAMVIFVDGSCKAQISPTDMCYPIHYVLTYPNRQKNKTLASNWDILMLSPSTFEHLDIETYPCFTIALDYIKRGGSFPATLVGANRAAVELFLNKQIKFTQIPDIINDVLAKHSSSGVPTIADIVVAVEEGYRNAKMLTQSLGCS